MKKGDIVKVFCPGEIDIGGQGKFSHFGNSQVPSGEDMTYEISMIDCALEPKSFTLTPPGENFRKGKPLREFDMFYLISNIKNVYGKEMVLDVSKEDKYAPLTSGVFNIFLNEKANTDSQTWWYDGQSNALHNKYHPTNLIILEGYNNNLVLYKS